MLTNLDPLLIPKNLIEFALCFFALVAAVAAKPAVLAYSSPYVAASPYTAAYTAAYSAPYAAAYSSPYVASPYAAAYSAYPYSYYFR